MSIPGLHAHTSTETAGADAPARHSTSPILQNRVAASPHPKFRSCNYLLWRSIRQWRRPSGDGRVEGIHAGEIPCCSGVGGGEL